MKPHLVKTTEAEPERSLERVALASAIAVHAAAITRLVAVQRARDSTDADCRSLQRAVEQAEQNIELAKTNAAQYLTAKALGKAGPAPQTVQEARAAIVQANDDLEAARSARDALDVELETAGREVGQAKSSIEVAIREVIQGERPLHDLLERHDRLARELQDIRGALSTLNIWMTPEQRLWSAIRDYPDLELETHWRFALKQLESDAGVELPE
jgi:chromosome segregation ATPase